MSAQQLDLFAGNQLDMLAPAALEQRTRGGMPRSVEERWERAFSLGVRQALLDAAMAKPGVWMWSRDFRAVIDQYDISSCHGHVLGAMARAGVLEEKNHYYGSERPGDGNYKGFNCLWRFRFPMSGVIHA